MSPFGRAYYVASQHRRDDRNNAHSVRNFERLLPWHHPLRTIDHIAVLPFDTGTASPQRKRK